MADDALTDAEREALRVAWRGPWGADRLITAVARIKAQARAEGARDALNAAAEWLTSTGYPVDYQMGVGTMPEPFWQAVVDVVHADKTGDWHGNTLDREETEDWLAGESGRVHFAAQHEEQP